MNPEPESRDVNRLPLAIARADVIAAQFIAGAAPVRFGIAQSAAELDAVYRLRYQVVVERGWAGPQDFPAPLEKDVYDRRGIHLVGRADGTVVATSRLVFPVPGQALPTEADFGLKVEPLGQVVDGGRAIVSKAYSDVRHRIFAGLLGLSWFQLKERRLYYLCGAATGAMVRLCRSIGYQVTLLGPAQQYWGEQRYPLRFDVLESVPQLWARWSQATGSSTRKTG